MQVATPNEIRENVLGLEPMEGGDETPLEREERQMEQQTQQFEKGFGMSSTKPKPKQEKPKAKEEPRGEEIRYLTPFLRLEKQHGKPWHTVVDEAWNATGTVRGFCQHLSVSHNTLPKMRARYLKEKGVEPEW